MRGRGRWLSAAVTGEAAHQDSEGMGRGSAYLPSPQPLKQARNECGIRKRGSSSEEGAALGMSHQNVISREKTQTSLSAPGWLRLQTGNKREASTSVSFWITLFRKANSIYPPGC